MNATRSNDSKGEKNNESTKPQHKRNDNSNPQQGTLAPKSVATSSTLTTTTAPSISPPSVDSFPLQRPTMKIPPSKKDSRKLFVGGLPSDVTGDEFRSFFEQFGEVLDSVVMLDRFNGRSRGFGFVTYVDPNVSLRLLRMGNNNEAAPDHSLVGRLEMRGKIVEVKSAEPKDYSNGPRRFHQTRTQHPFMNRNPGFGGTPVHYGDPNAMMYGAPMDYAYPHQPYFSPFATGYMAYPMVYDPTFPGAPVYHPHAPVPQPPPPVAAEVAQGVPAMAPGHQIEGMAQHPPTMEMPQAASGVPQFAQHHNHAHPAPYQQGSTMHPAAPGLPVRDGEILKDTQANESS